MCDGDDAKLKDMVKKGKIITKVTKNNWKVCKIVDLGLRFFLLGIYSPLEFTDFTP